MLGLNNKSHASFSDFYEFIVGIKHKTGDIWLNLPTFGLLKQSQVAGIVITPACDLSNLKTETITYLPIIPLKHYFNLECFYPICRNRLLEIINADISLKPWSDIVASTLPKSMLPDLDGIAEAHSIFTNECKSDESRIKTLLLLSHISHICGHLLAVNSVSKLKTAFTEAAWNKTVKSLISNQNADSYFLPNSRTNKDGEAIPEDGLVMFRYPLTIPFIFLETAMNSVTHKGWVDSIAARSSAPLDLLTSFTNVPVKSQRLRESFLKDLITRYAGLYLRLGSPDLSEPLIAQIVKSLTE